MSGTTTARLAVGLSLVALALTSACTSGGGTASPTTATVSSPTRSASGSGSSSPTSSGTPVTATTAAGDPVASIPGTRSADDLLAAARPLVQDASEPAPITLADGTIAHSVGGSADNGQAYGIDVYTAPTSGNVVQVNCGSNAPPSSPDALRELCLDIAPAGAPRQAAAAWVASSLAALPAGADTTSSGISDLDLAGLEWKVYRSRLLTGQQDAGYVWVTVAVQGRSLPNVDGS